MQRLYRLFLLGNLIASPLYSQDLSYYLPQDIEYDKSIPAPETILGHPVGAWHASHDKLVWYLTTLAEASDRISIETYAHTYEGRPLLLLTITSTQNHSNIESLRNKHLQLSDPESSAALDVNDMPLVVWMGYSVHGNEASGTNASLLAAYYLAAAQGPKIEEMLDNTIILLDPSINPDGMNRFASWVNSHKSKNLDPNPQSLEHNEAWPRGRTNHYWFDLNRDWLPLQHPESKGRLHKFHQWKPNILTDHHEMGSQRTFFFQPGEPTRNHPLTPAKTFELTGAIAKYHARALDKIGSLYYSGEGYDDFYYGKGSTYPDVNGGIGILFEQASARGHLQKTKNGLLSFPFAIRNQFTTTLSTLEAAVELREELLNHQREFYSSALQQAAADDIKAYLFGERDLARVYHFLDILNRHQIKSYQISRDVQASGKTFSKEHSFIVPLNQGQYRLIKAIFEQRTSFQDSLFYDVSAWTLPLAYNLSFTALDRRTFANSMLGAEVSAPKLPEGRLSGGKSDYGYVISWHHYYAPRAVAKLLRQGLRAAVATENMVGDFGNFKPGTVIIPVTHQNKSPEEIHTILEGIAKDDGVDVTALSTGFSPSERSWGSPSMEALQNPKIVVVSDGDVSGYEAGEVWHLLDHRFDIPMTLIAQDKMGGVDLSEYNIVVLVNGQYKSMNKAGIEKLKNWVQAGGVVVAWKNGAKWLADQNISTASFEKEQADTTSHLAYGDRKRHSGAQVIGGAIFETEADLSHPLLFGYQQAKIPVFKNHALFLKRSNNPFTNPLMYTDSPLLSGYISSKKLAQLANTPALEVSHVGKGKVISLADNPNFRAFWLGTNKLFLNTLFFGHFLDPESIK